MKEVYPRQSQEKRLGSSLEEAPVQPGAKKPNYPARRLGASILAGLAATVTAAGGYELLSNRHLHDPNVNYGEKDPAVTSLQLQDGARIRTAPTVPNHNSPENDTFLSTISRADLEEYFSDNTIDILVDGIYTKQNNNGEWYGFNAEYIEEALPNANVPTHLDRDGIIWVNEQSATFTIEQPED